MKINKILIISYFVLLVSSSQYSLANEFNLPDLGTPSDSVLSPIKEKEIRDQIINQIYEYDLVITDPIIADYIEQLGYKLASKSDNPASPFDFFMVNANVVNASAYPGGLIVIYSGLFLKSDSESELAGVVAHEIAHITQRHLSRAYANAKKNTIPTILGMLGAVAAAQYSNSRDAPVAIAAVTTALQQQSMINFTRVNEYEADRVGMATLVRSSFDPNGMADFFAKLMRNNPIDQRYKLPEYLRTHPLSINRVSEAKNRAQKHVKNTEYYESELYSFVKERVRVISKHIEIDNVSYYRGLFKNTDKLEITPAQYYGYALALHHSHESDKALEVIRSVKKSNQSSLIISLLEANILADIDWGESKKRFEELYDFYPESPKVIEPYIQMLAKSNKPSNTKRARILARKLIQLYPDNPNYFQVLAISNQNAGRSIEANEALAFREHLIHNNYRAVRILKNILKEDLDYYQRARIESKITEFESLITNKERSREILEEKTGRRRLY
ncbi:MAG: M48 family metalloprotease [Proteobacteria bacterium]|nr:M48 family metalloprotease [Pseudomonadota bacterium]